MTNLPEDDYKKPKQNNNFKITPFDDSFLSEDEQGLSEESTDF